MSQYYEKARRIYERQQQREIEIIALKLEEADKLKQQQAIQKNCPHKNVTTYHDDYQIVCEDCGAVWLNDKED